eukprot:scaffold20382_cov129-Isochrysis_galbana.AAC.6
MLRPYLSELSRAQPLAQFSELFPAPTPSQGWTALHKAALLHRVDDATCLMDLGADINLRTNVSHGPRPD